jgi:hypothetical protein
MMDDFKKINQWMYDCMMDKIMGRKIIDEFFFLKYQIWGLKMKSETMVTHSSIVQASNISRHCNFLGCYPQGSVVKFVGET